MGRSLVNFFATWCGPVHRDCTIGEPEIWQKYRDRGLTVLVIGVGEQEGVLYGIPNEAAGCALVGPVRC